MAFVAPIVEGQGEQEAVPALLHRLNLHLGTGVYLAVNPPIRVKSGSFLNDDEYLKRYVSLAASKARSNSGTVLIMLDCEDFCPAQLGPSLLAKAQAVCADIRIVVALAYREYETWFIAASQSLQGKFGLPNDLSVPNSLDMRDAKGWLGARMPSGYDPVSHQLSFTKTFDLDQAKVVHSFNRLCERMPQLLGLQ